MFAAGLILCVLCGLAVIIITFLPFLAGYGLLAWWDIALFIIYSSGMATGIRLMRDSKRD